MRYFVLLLLACVTLSYASEMKNFLLWAKEHGKTYKTQAELYYRFNVWSENKIKVTEFNKGEHSYRQGLNAFSDLTFEEFAATYLMPERHSLFNVVRDSATTLPEVDWRNEGAVAPIQVQGTTFIGLMNDTFRAIESNRVINGGTLLKLSEQQVVSCASAYGNSGCNGGLPEYAFEYVTDYGQEAETTYVYTALTGTCNVETTITGHVIVTHTESAIQSAIEITPVSIVLYADSNFQNYESGIFDDSDCPTHSYNHAVTLVGEGNSGSTGYYILRNSWGDSWGESGYMRIIAGSNMCGLTLDPSYPTGATAA